jgi:MarR-like DNA-binding transcriptional regulator SgrR of sgrS sRNA
VPWLPLAHAKQVIALSKKVKNFKLHPTSKKDFRQVWMER